VERAERLRKGNEFDTVYSKGTVVGGPLLVVRHLPNNAGVTRWGFAVGKRLSKHATDRNRTKRRLRASAEALALIPCIDIVVTARNGAIQARYAELARALARTLSKAGLLVEDGDR
jgi:ribonuclease P protein component